MHQTAHRKEGGGNIVWAALVVVVAVALAVTAMLACGAMFFAGIEPQAARNRTEEALPAIGCALFVGATVWIATFPVSVSV